MTDKEKAEELANTESPKLEGAEILNSIIAETFVNGYLSACEDKSKDIEELVKLTSEYMDFMYNHSRMSRSMHETWANLHMNLENILNKHK